MQHVRGVVQCGFQVVRDHDDRDPFLMQLADDLVHLGRRFGVQAGDRLIQQQAFPGGAQGAGQKHPLLLPAGKLPVAPAFKSAQAQPFQIPGGHRLFLPGVKGPQAALPLKAGADDLLYRGRKIPLHLGLLGQVANFRGAQPFHANGPGQGSGEIQNGFHQRGLAGAVLSHNAQVVPGVYGKAQIGDDRLAVIAQRCVFTDDLRHIFFSLTKCLFQHLAVLFHNG